MKIARLIAIAGALTIAFSGVAVASWLADPTLENQTQTFNRISVTGDQGLYFWKGSASGNLSNRLSYEERSTKASGKFEFRKVMSYTSKYLNCDTVTNEKGKFEKLGR